MKVEFAYEQGELKIYREGELIKRERLLIGMSPDFKFYTDTCLRNLEHEVEYMRGKGKMLDVKMSLELRAEKLK